MAISDQLAGALVNKTSNAYLEVGPRCPWSEGVRLRSSPLGNTSYATLCTDLVRVNITSASQDGTG